MTHFSDKTVHVIAGPTASGKTAAAIRLARSLGAEIISADSRQCYRELRIGVARPSPEELAAVPHHFIASHSVTENLTAADFEAYALMKAEALFGRANDVVMVGGTGLYIQAFCEGLDAIPEIPAAIRDSIRSEYEAGGMDWLQAAVQAEDPGFYAVGEIRNPHRLLRALEVKRATGASILTFRSGKKKQRPFAIRKYALQIPKEELHDRIHLRVDRMMEEGLLDEVRSLMPYRYLPALQTVGYRELFAFLDGDLSLGQTVTDIKTNTRRYAKRQLTWFRKDPGFTWVSPDHF